MSDQPKNSKVATYLAAGGALGIAQFVLFMPVWITLPLVAAATLPITLNPKRKEIFSRIGAEAKELFSDFKMHAKADLKSLKKWWDNRSFARAKPQETVRAPSTEAPSTFNADATAKNDFGAKAKPGADKAVEAVPETKPAPAAKPAVPNGPNGPK